LVSLLIFAAAGQWEKATGFYDVKLKYEELTNDPIVISAVIRSSPHYDIPISQADPVYGSPSAPYPIVFFSDFQCPICARTEKALKQIVAVNPGVLKLVYKNYPLSRECNPELLSDLHPMACQAARAAYAAFLLGGDAAFWNYADMLFGHRAQLRNRPWVMLAEKTRLDPKNFEELLKQEGPAARKVQEDLELGLKLGIVSTPQIFFAGKRIPENFRGAFLVDALEDLIRYGDPTKKDLSLKRK
jgi:protein-disulfide isomerase